MNDQNLYIEELPLEYMFSEDASFNNILLRNLSDFDNMFLEDASFNGILLRNLSDFDSLTNLTNSENQINELFENSQTVEKPTDSNFIENMELKTFVDLKQKKECCLCLSAFENNDKFYELPCGHCFHDDSKDECGGIIKWLEKNNTCPVCRYELPLQENVSNNQINNNQINDNQEVVEYNTSNISTMLNRILQDITTNNIYLRISPMTLSYIHEDIPNINQ